MGKDLQCGSRYSDAFRRHSDGVHPTLPHPIAEGVLCDADYLSSLLIGERRGTAEASDFACRNPRMGTRPPIDLYKPS